MKTLLLSFLLFFSFSINAQHTFSIVAADPVTGEIGSAGATCLTSADCGGCGGAVIINELVIGKGAINAQATVCIPNSNAQSGSNRISFNNTAPQVLNYLLANDNCQFGDTSNRQYGIVTINNGIVETASFTGSNALNYANHIVGSNYAIQGNILIGQEVLDGMEQGFLNTEGTLAQKLMGAMQGANIVGADARCAPDGLSSKSSFLRVAHPDDVNNYSVNLIVPSTEEGIDPIDSLQSLFDTQFPSSINPLDISKHITIYPNPSEHTVYLEGLPQIPLNIDILDLTGKKIDEFKLNAQQRTINFSKYIQKGIFFIKGLTSEGTYFYKKVLIL